MVWGKKWINGDTLNGAAELNEMLPGRFPEVRATPGLDLDVGAGRYHVDGVLYTIAANAVILPANKASWAVYDTIAGTNIVAGAFPTTEWFVPIAIFSTDASGIVALEPLLAAPVRPTIPVRMVSVAMSVAGLLSAIAPLINAGTGIAPAAFTAVEFQVMRNIKETAGITTIDLMLDGVAVPGTTLTFTAADANRAVKSAAIAVAVTAGQLLSLSISTAGTSAQDIVSGVHS